MGEGIWLTPSPDMSRLLVCRRCFELRGPWRDEAGEFVQECACDRSRRDRQGRPRQQRWPRFDFNTVAELCQCCGAEVLRSGSRWAVWFCAHCKARVEALNHRVGGCVIPIGRHSIMNGYSLDASAQPSTEELDGFLDAMVGLIEGSNRLEVWSREVVAANLRAIGTDRRRNPPVTEYLERMAIVGCDKAQAFEELCDFWRNPSTSVTPTQGDPHLDN